MVLSLHQWEYRLDVTTVAPVFMRLAAFLPNSSARYVQAILPRTEMLFAKNLAELSEILRTGSSEAALIDPHTNGNNTEPVLEIIRRYPRARFIAYVPRTSQSLRAVFSLSKEGLEDVFVHPVNSRDARFLNVIRKIEADNLASDVLDAAECRLLHLSPSVGSAVRDLFRTPYRYASAKDLADEAGMSLRCLYRALSTAEFGTPRKLIAMAKVIHGYIDLRSSPAAIRRVSTRLGYGTPGMFSKQMVEHLGIRPTQVALLSTEDALIHLIEGLYKPTVLQLHSRSSRLKRQLG